MINESYSASCYIGNDNGKYTIECDLQTNDKYAEATYNGTSLANGLNQIMDELENQITKQSEPEETLEEKIARLEAENAQLKAVLGENTNKTSVTKNTDKSAAKVYSMKDLLKDWDELFGDCDSDRLKKYLGL